MKNQTEVSKKSIARHTPGPWEIVGIDFEDDKGMLAITAGSRKKKGICLLSKYKNTSEAAATAMLIAAAPEMLEMLEAVMFDNGEWEQPVHYMTEELRDRCISIIAKAKGDD